MGLASEQQPGSPQRRRVAVPLLKASLTAALLFVLAWTRLPLSAASAQKAVSIFIVFGIPIIILSMLIGMPIIRLLLRLKVQRWWVYVSVAAAVGALSSGVFSSRPSLPTRSNGAVHVVITFSPWTQSSPLDEHSTLTLTDYLGSIAFGALVGGALGACFWYFSNRQRRFS